MKRTHSTLCTALRCAYHLFLWLALILLGKEYLSLSASQTWLENYLSEHYTEFYIAHSVSWGPQLACALAVLAVRSLIGYLVVHHQKYSIAQAPQTRGANLSVPKFYPLSVFPAPG